MLVLLSEQLPINVYGVVSIQEQDAPNHQNQIQQSKQKNYRAQTIPIPINGRGKHYAKAVVVNY
jgi:hypothetical protein